MRFNPIPNDRVQPKGRSEYDSSNNPTDYPEPGSTSHRIRFPFSAFGGYFATAQLKTEIRNYLLLFFACLAFHLLGSAALPLIDRDEPRFAEASREMRERQNYIVPYFNGQYRFDKPPLTYWAQVASYRLFGENDFAARFPSAVAAALTALVIFSWGRRISDEKTALAAAIIFTLCLQTFVHAKAAVADMWLVLFMTKATYAGFEIISGSKRRPPAVALAKEGTPNWVWWLTFYVCLALAFLAKGPIGLIPIIPFVAMMIQQRKFKLHSFFAGLLVTFGIISIWAIPALLQTHGEFLRIGIGRHVIGRSVGAMEGHGAKSFGLYLLLLPFYFVAVFVTFLPWSFKLPGLFSRLRKERDVTDLYLLWGIGSIFGIFTLVATKLPHYTLPAFPLLAVLLARHWFKRDSDFSVFNRIALVAALVLIAVALVLPLFVSRFFPSYVLFDQSRESLRPDMEIGSIDYAEPSIVWYFRLRVKGFVTPLTKKNAQEFVSRPGPRLIVMPANETNLIFQESFAVHWQRFSATGFNIPKGKKVDLLLLLKPE